MHNSDRFLPIVGVVLIFIAVATMLTLMTLSSVPVASPTPIKLRIATSTSPRDAEGEYYRGIYDICVQYGLRGNRRLATVSEACRGYVRRLVAKDWYKGRSPGWEWPMRVVEDGG